MEESLEERKKRLNREKVKRHRDKLKAMKETEVDNNKVKEEPKYVKTKSQKKRERKAQEHKPEDESEDSVLEDAFRKNIVGRLDKLEQEFEIMITALEKKPIDEEADETEDSKQSMPSVETEEEKKSREWNENSIKEITN